MHDGGEQARSGSRSTMRGRLFLSPAVLESLKHRGRLNGPTFTRCQPNGYQGRFAFPKWDQTSYHLQSTAPFTETETDVPPRIDKSSTHVLDCASSDMLRENSVRALDLIARGLTGNIAGATFYVVQPLPAARSGAVMGSTSISAVRSMNRMTVVFVGFAAISLRKT